MMTMEGGGLVEQRREAIGNVSKRIGYVAHHHKSMKKKQRQRRRIQRSFPKVPVALQELYDSCKDVFRGPGTVPSFDDVQKLCNIIDKMKPEDVGLSSNLQFFTTNDVVKGTPIVTNTTIYKCKNFSLCLFFLPATAVIPLHNHPGMTVFSKLLLGTMHIKSYDWVDPDDTTSPSKPRLAKLIANDNFTAPCDTSVLFPTTGGNIHEFTAITTCAVLDVLGPPYSAEDGRNCSYYKELPYNTVSRGENSERIKEDEGEKKYEWLEEIEAPVNSHMDEIEYLGPQIIDRISP